MIESETMFTAAELIKFLQAFPPETPVKAMGLSSMTAFPFFAHVTSEGVIELIGDEQA